MNPAELRRLYVYTRHAVYLQGNAYMVKEITGDGGLKESVEVIRNSFRTVADEFGLTEENCPTNPAFISFTKLRELRDKRVRMFGLFCGNRQIGFVAIEKSNDYIYYMETSKSQLK